MASGQGNRQRLEETMHLSCHNLWDLEEQTRRSFLNLSYGGKEKSQTRGTFIGRHKKTTQGVDH